MKKKTTKKTITKKRIPKPEPIDINHFGDYRMGLTDKEIMLYLCNRAAIKRNKYYNMSLNKIYKIFCEIAGCNTGAVGPNGECLMYRHDVERFADQMFDGTPTYFD